MITIVITDTISMRVLLAYCAGKGWLFNLFFGWRHTHKDTYFFKLPRKDWKKLQEIIQNNY